jgi:uncharacterized membrane protein
MIEAVAFQKSSVANGKPATTTVVRHPRLDSIDLLRGMIMVLMALDHVRPFFLNSHFDPLDLSRTSPALFLTRWVTHFCAPNFVFLAGTGAFLYGTRVSTKCELAWFLLTRGLWIFVLEFTLVHLGWFFNFEYPILIGQVMWAIGLSMMALAGLVFFPTWAVTLIGIVLIAGHNALDVWIPVRDNVLPWPWIVLLRPGPVPLPGGLVLAVGYPVLPWLGVMAVGYGFGTIWLLDQSRRRPILFGMGLSIIAAFISVRFANQYGNPRPWESFDRTDLTVMSFVNCEKYPPSLAFLLMTLGAGILALAVFDRPAGPVGRVFITFGRVPLFYYLLHVPLIHFLAILTALFRYHDVTFLFSHPTVNLDRFPEGYGFDLAVVYLAWVVVVLCLYPPCVWFAGVKARHRDGWLSYL